ncbi:MAG: hypothetical protein K9K64_03080, partial [Desulfohalobiaceae bacterium]|nr:hypothetical protein [Desulfohalobiaceae bacterium]
MPEATLAGPLLLQALLADEFEILQDRDQDGFADHIHLVFHYSPEFNDPQGWAELLNLNAVLAFQSLSLDQPLLRPQGSLEPEDRPLLEVLGKNGQTRHLAELLRREPGRMQLQGTSPRAVAELLRLLRRPLSLASGLVPSWQRVCLSDQETDTFNILDHAGRPLARIARTLAGEVYSEPGPTATTSEIVDLLEPGPAMFEPGSPESRQSTLNLAVDLDSDRISAELGAALNDFILSCVMQATRIRLPIASTRRPPGSGLLLRVREDRQDPSGWPLRLDQDQKTGRSLILARGRSQAIAPALSSWTRLTLQGPGGLQSSPGREIRETRDILLGRGRRGSWAHCLTAALLKGRPLPPAAASELSWLKKTLSRLDLADREPESLAPVVREYIWPKETDVIRDLIRDLPPGQGDLQGLVLISKPLALRRSLQAELAGILREKGYSPNLEVLNAYKAGLSWLLETVWPALRSGPPLEDIELAYQPFQPGQGSLEMTSRWLQEIFPGPDLLAEELGWDPEAVSLVENQDQSAVYRLRTRDVQGRVRQWEFSPRWRVRPYLSTNPEAGLVHPCCAGARLCQGGRTLLDLDLPTDRDRFWERFQHEWLPLLDRQMRSRLQRLPLDKTAAPFWEEIRITVCIQETDLRLGLDEERVCPLEALHEDLYFVLLAFFQDFAGQHGLPEYLHLGRIHPRVRTEGGGHQPWAEFKASPMSWFTENPETVSGPCPVTGLSVGDGREEIRFSCGAPQKELEVLCSLARSWGHDLLQSGEEVQLRLGCASAPLPSGRTERTSLLPPLPEDRYLQAGEIASWIADLGREAVV